MDIAPLLLDAERAVEDMRQALVNRSPLPDVTLMPLPWWADHTTTIEQIEEWRREQQK